MSETDNKRPTPITDAFFHTFQDGLAAPSHDEYYHRLCDLERQLAEACEENSKLYKALSDASAIYDVASEQRDRLAEACKKLMKVIGPPNATIEQCWAGVDEIDEAYIAGEQALAAVKGGKP